jgi:hypothetical protein
MAGNHCLKTEENRRADRRFVVSEPIARRATTIGLATFKAASKTCEIRLGKFNLKNSWGIEFKPERANQNSDGEVHPIRFNMMRRLVIGQDSYTYFRRIRLPANMSSGEYVFRRICLPANMSSGEYVQSANSKKAPVRWRHSLDNTLTFMHKAPKMSPRLLSIQPGL